jgi:hypothetical protein
VCASQSERFSPEDFLKDGQKAQIEKLTRDAGTAQRLTNRCPAVAGLCRLPIDIVGLSLRPPKRAAMARQETG